MKLNLKRQVFTECEYELISHGSIKVFVFKYSTGVEALRIENKKRIFYNFAVSGSADMENEFLWKRPFYENNLSMKTTIKEPVPTTEYLKTYGGFLYHCGISASDVPQEDDTLVLKKQSIAQNKRNAMLSKRRRFVDKKPNVFERFKTISEEMLKSSRSNMTFSKYIRMSLLFSLGGVIIGLLLNNILLSVVLAVGMLFVPLEYLVVRQSSYTQMINEQMETALSLITNSYLQSGDNIKTVKENLHRIELPFYNLFAEFIAEKTFVDSNISRNIRKLKNKVDNSFFSEWCDTLILCQQDRELMYVLPIIVEKMSDIKQIQEELNTQMYNIYKDHISVTLVVAANIPLMRFLNAEWYRLLTQTLAGQIIVALTFGVIFIATAYVIKVNKPVSVL